jgi:hypothetical protein
MRVLRRSLAGLTCAAVLVGGSAIALADEPGPYRVQAVSAARWLVGELATAADVAAYDAANPTAKGGLVEGTLPGQIVDKPPPTDWGLTIDALLALKATGADDAEANKIADRVAAHVGSFIGDPAAPEKRVSGSIAKEIVAAVAGGRNPRDFGGFDLAAELTGLMVKDGDEKGRFKDRVTVPSEDRTNNFGQALGVMGLARIKALPQEAVDFLIKQQCPAGGFQLFVKSGPACEKNEESNVDVTGMAVQALLDAEEAGVPGTEAAVTKAVAYLKTTQGADGEFSDSAAYPNPNTNSTGLAAQALAAVGEMPAADKSAAWVTGLQGPLPAEKGAIAPNKDAFTADPADAENGRLPSMYRDSWRRATAQASLGLTRVRLGHGTTQPPLPPDPTTTPPSTTPPAPSSSTTPPTSSSSSTTPSTTPDTGTSTTPGSGDGSQTPRNLASTGVEAGGFAFGGLALLGAGLGLVLVARRRSAA